ncbi:hypothetical protein PFMC_03994, partial [Plasmodium falciparum CAMP/Malaysia]
MAPGGGGHGGGEEDKDAKHMFDRIGQQVHDKVKKEVYGTGASGDAKKYIEELKAGVSFATLSGGELAAFPEPCKLIKDKGHKILAARGHPCRKEDVDRFSDKEGAQCNKSRIRDSEKNSEGACAPYRRLHVCDRNLEQIKTENITTHNLLVDVCMAANYEAQSLIRYHDLYKLTYDDSQICTVLARSFADIGDIVRGKDLYRRDKGEETKLEKNLQNIFKEIYEELKDPRAKERYKDTKNFYQLREDWWTANRHTVWKAITCSDDLKDNRYFRQTCSDTHGSFVAIHYCRCNNDQPNADNPNTDPPTYFDYVPQYLRWFEEWAEDFCRKKKKYVDIVKTYCRDETKGKYCSLNGYDCTKTKLAIGKYRMGNQCTKCFFACYPYEKWIEKQKEQFDKQKKKYTDEMKKYKNGGGGSGSRRQRRAARNENYEGYEKKFYDELKGNYSDVNAFLEKLNKEKACTAVDDDKGGKIDFKNVHGGTSDTSGTNVESQGTFYRSKYCQPCPHCGMKRKSDGSGWEERKENDNCKNINLYKPINGKNGTTINFLYSGDETNEIGKKLKAFCDQINRGTTNAASGGGSKSDSQKLYQDWKCYQFEDLQKDGQDGVEDEDDGEYDGLVRNSGGLCILENKKHVSGNNSSNEPAEIQKTFHDFFYYWVAHMLKDSIYWRTKKLGRCLENNNGNTCKKNNCNDKCKCYESW